VVGDESDAVVDLAGVAESIAPDGDWSGLELDMGAGFEELPAGTRQILRILATAIAWGVLIWRSFMWVAWGFGFYSPVLAVEGGES